MYMGHVAKYVGGIMETPKMVEEKGPVYENVAKGKAKRSGRFFEQAIICHADLAYQQ